MIGFLLSGLAGLGTRAALAAAGAALWLVSRPGGWAVLAVLVLLALRWFPEAVSPAP